MDEAEAERHRKRVVAFAVLAAIFAAALNGYVAHLASPKSWNWDEKSGYIIGPFYHVECPLPTHDLIQIPTLTALQLKNLGRAVPAAAGIAALVVAVGGVVIEMPNRRGTTAKWVSASYWVWVCMAGCVLAQTAAVYLRPQDPSLPPDLVEMSVEAIVRGFALGVVAALLWAIPRLIFRRIDDADWWLRPETCLRFRFAAAAGVIAAVAFGTSIFFTEPRDVDKRVRGQWVCWGGAYPHTMIPTAAPPYGEEKRVAAVAWYESRLRTWNRCTVVPVVVAVTFLVMAVGGVVLQGPVRFHFAGWFALWTLAGVGSHLGAVWLRGDLWRHYVPVGTSAAWDFVETLLRGGLIGAILGFAWLFVVAVYDRLASPTAPRRYG